MSWWKNGLLLAAGGVAGLFIAALLEDEDGGGRPSPKIEEKDGVEILISKIRREAEWALEECVTEEQREEVYAQIAKSVHEFQDELEKQGEAMIEELRMQMQDEIVIQEEDEVEAEEKANEHVEKIKDTMDRLKTSLDETLKDIGCKEPAFAKG